MVYKLHTYDSPEFKEQMHEAFNAVIQKPPTRQIRIITGWAGHFNLQVAFRMEAEKCLSNEVTRTRKLEIVEEARANLIANYPMYEEEYKNYKYES